MVVDPPQPGWHISRTRSQTPLQQPTPHTRYPHQHRRWGVCRKRLYLCTHHVTGNSRCFITYFSTNSLNIRKNEFFSLFPLANNDDDTLSADCKSENDYSSPVFTHSCVCEGSGSSESYDGPSCLLLGKGWKCCAEYIRLLAASARANHWPAFRFRGLCIW